MPREYQPGFELRHLIYFREVARTRHFHRASVALAVAQPALSRAVAQLEAALGTPLFTRSRRGAEITPAGRVLAERIEPLLREVARLPADVQAAARGEHGLVRIAFTGLAMATVLPALLRAFQQRHPSVRLVLNESPTAVQLGALRSGEFDCGFFHPEAPAPDLATHELLRERNGVLLPAGHPAAGRPRLRLRDLAATPFVLFPRVHNPGFYDRILAAFAAAGFSPQIAEEIWPRANAVGLVRAGLGATFMTPSEARILPREVRFCRVLGPAPESRLVLGWRPEPAPGASLAAFLAVATAARPGGPAARSTSGSTRRDG